MLDTNQFLLAIDELEKQGIQREITIQALKEAFETIVKKKHVEGLPDLMVKVEILPEEGRIDIYNIKNIVEEVEDDAIEISAEEAKEIEKPNFIEGDQVFFKIEIDDFKKNEAMKFKTILRQKIKEAEKQAIMALYSDRVDELITGYVEKNEARYTLLNIDRTSVVLNDKEKIGNETFEIGQAVKVYLQGVTSGGESGITISRACPGFLKRLFEEEIPDIYNGAVIIKDIAREAGERSKVSVYSNELGLDPVGACIGQKGSKIQNICNQINREKIDIIEYHEHKGLFVSECLKPANVIGTKLQEDGSVIAVVKDGDLRVAIGKKGINARLASKLAGCKIFIKEESVAIEEGIIYDDMNEMIRQNEAIKEEIRKQAALKSFNERKENLRIQLEQEALEAAQKAQEEANTPEIEEIEEETIEETTVVNEPVVEEIVEEEVQEETVEFTPVIMQSKISLADLEKQIEEEKKKKNNQGNSSKKKSQKEEKVEVKKETTTRMDIYTQEELDEFEEEYDDYEYDDDEDIDYDEYDEYYEE